MLKFNALLTYNKFTLMAFQNKLDVWPFFAHVSINISFK